MENYGGLEDEEILISNCGMCERLSNPFTASLQFNSYKSVQKLFHNLHIIFSNSLMGFSIICQLEKKTSEGTCQRSRNIFLNSFFARLTVEMSRTSLHIN